MAPSTVSISKSTFLASQGSLLVVLEPLKQIRADLSNAKHVFPLIHDIVAAYSFPFFRAINSARRLWYLMHSLPIPPVIVNISGVNVPCSMSRTLLEY